MGILGGITGDFRRDHWRFQEGSLGVSGTTTSGVQGEHWGRSGITAETFGGITGSFEVSGGITGVSAGSQCGCRAQPHPAALPGRPQAR